MSVDLEDYFCDLPFSEWPKYQSRIEMTTEKMLEEFDKYHVKATFFTLGYIADNFPHLIKKIYDKGHELASHSYSHIDLRKVTKEEFEKDFLKSLKSIKNITGEKVLGFRAPFFSINSNNFWVFDILRKHVKYDSSIFPVKTTQYGISHAPTKMYHPSQKNILEDDKEEKFIEIPPLTYRLLGYDLPIAGGFYFRFFPFFLIKKGINKSNKQNATAMIYIHPKDLDYNMPKVKSYSWHFYYGKKNILQKFQKLLTEFKFGTAKEVLGL